MTQEEYKLRKQALNEQHQKDNYVLDKEFAFSNSEYKIGDIVTDHIGSIKVESMKFQISFGSDLPTCVYEGVELKKDLTPMKKGTKRKVWATNITKSI